MAQEGKSQQSSHLTRAYIGLGSNDGDRLGFVQQAMQLLKDIPRIQVVECSSVYETEPKGNESCSWFVNAVTAVDTDLSAEELLDVCRDIEARLGQLPIPKDQRKRSKSQAINRIIDLDILFFGDKAETSDYLVIPHPFVHQRAYALVPLLEIAPELRHPGLSKTVSELHDELEDPEQIFLYGTRIDAGLAD